MATAPSNNISYEMEIGSDAAIIILFIVYIYFIFCFMTHTRLTFATRSPYSSLLHGIVSRCSHGGLPQNTDHAGWLVMPILWLIKYERQHDDHYYCRNDDDMHHVTVRIYIFLSLLSVSNALRHIEIDETAAWQLNNDIISLAIWMFIGGLVPVCVCLFIWNSKSYWASRKMVRFQILLHITEQHQQTRIWWNLDCCSSWNHEQEHFDFISMWMNTYVYAVARGTQRCTNKTIFGCVQRKCMSIDRCNNANWIWPLAVSSYNATPRHRDTGQ